jgi:nucleoside-diphosphate-sugar epimerase
MSNLHVIFGTGPLGSAIMRVLLKQGQNVRMVNRSGKRPEGAPASVEVVASDAYQSQNVRKLTEGAAVAYQCAQPAYHQWPELFPPLQSSIIEGVAQSQVKLVVAENLYMYAPSNQPLHEGLPYAAKTRKGKTRAAMAQQLIDAYEKGKIKVTMGRAGDFYGVGVLDSSAGERLFGNMVAGKTASAVGDIDQPHTYSVVDDFGQALVLLGSRPEALGRAWHTPNPPTITTRQLAAMAAEQLGIPLKISAMGTTMMRIGSLFVPVAHEMVEMMYAFNHPFVIDHSAFSKAFGEFYTPHQQAVQATLAWYKAHQQAAVSV